MQWGNIIGLFIIHNRRRHELLERTQYSTVAYSTTITYHPVSNVDLATAFHHHKQCSDHTLEEVLT